jgi:predicted amidohydrolase
MSPVRFAAVQMNSTDDVAANLEVASELLDRAAEAGAALTVLPENFAGIGAGDACRRDIAEPDGSGPIQTFIADAAKRTGMWIVGGTIPLSSEDPERPFASCLIFDASGRCAGRYDKIHLFDVGIPGSEETYRESGNTTPGSAALVLDSPWGRLGVAICYDLRFPEMFRHLADAGMDFLVLPAAFTVTTGRAHWRSLLRARAIENLCYVVAAAQTGIHAGGRRTWGHSTIIDPWGKILGDADDAIGCISAEIDPDRLQRLRREFPVLSHRKFDVNGPD